MFYFESLKSNWQNTTYHPILGQGLLMQSTLGIAFVHPVSKKVVFVVAPWMKIAPDPNEDIFSLDERIEGRW